MNFEVGATAGRRRAGETPAVDDPVGHDAPVGTMTAPGGSTGRQAAWNYLVFALCKSSTLIMTIVVARLLDPAEFGLFALALLVVNLFDYVKDLGVGAALVQSRRDWHGIAPTALLLSSAFGVLASATLAGTAGFSAQLLGHAELAQPIRVLAIGLGISAAAAVPAAWVRRQMSFSSRLVPEFAGALAKTGVTIALAAAGHGVWSLVYGQLAAAILTAALYWITARAPLGIGFDAAEARLLIRFGLPVTALTLLAFAIYNVDYLSVGTRLGTTELGLYTLAYRLPELVILNLCVVISEVLFSALSRLQHDRAGLAAHYRQVLVVVVALTTPIGVGMALGADAAIGTMYGAAYASAGPILTILAIYALVYSVSFHAGDVFKAVGRPGVLTAINAGKFAVLIGPVWWAAGRSAVLVAAVLLAVEVVHCVVRLVIVSRMTGLRAPALLGAVAPPLLAAIPMVGVMWSIQFWIGHLGSFAQTVILGLAGGLSYLVALRFTAPRLVDTAVRLLRRRHGAIESTGTEKS